MVLSVLIVVAAIVLGAVYYHQRDEPKPPTPSWANPIARDPEAVEALVKLFELESPLGEIEEAERDRIARGCLAGTATAASQEDEPNFLS